MGNKLRVLDLGSTLDYSKLGPSFESGPLAGESPNELFTRLGRAGINAIFEASSPDTYQTLQNVKHTLDTAGVVVLQETNVHLQSDRVAQLSTIAIASVFGTPTQTDQKSNQIAWPIRYDPGTRLTPTFSQSLGEAAYHTDTQYFANPEKYFGLFCITSDEPGKGTNKLISGIAAVEQFEDRYGPDAGAQLERDYPFKVPSVFTRHAREDEVEITWAPIFNRGTGTIRYRRDTIEAALRAGKITLDDRRLDALAKFDSILNEVDAISYHLTPGEGILVNNLRILHARTSFDNPDRFLYRVRMREDAKV